MKAKNVIDNVTNLFIESKIDFYVKSKTYYFRVLLSGLFKKIKFLSNDDIFNLSYRVIPNGIDIQKLFGTYNIPLFSPMLFLTINYLFNKNLRISNILEFGSGGSTIYFSRLRNGLSINSIETDEYWYEIVKSNTAENVNLIFVKLDSYELESYERDYEKYCLSNRMLENYSDLALNSSNYDFYIIDGLDRKRILLNIISQELKQDSIILVHDYCKNDIEKLYPTENISSDYYFFDIGDDQNSEFLEALNLQYSPYQKK